jgi:hypothetical protein
MKFSRFFFRDCFFFHVLFLSTLIFCIIIQDLNLIKDKKKEKKFSVVVSI